MPASQMPMTCPMPVRAVLSKLDPMSGSWPMVVVDLVVVVALGSISRVVADRVSGQLAGWLVFVATTSVLVFVIVAIPLRSILLAQRRRAAVVTDSLRVENERRDFEARLSRALEMTDDEGAALALSMRAIASCGPDLEALMLLADNSDAHLQAMASTDGATVNVHCNVATPRGCPAIRNGQLREFASSNELDTCPHLAARGVPDLAAVCVPITLVGRATGVVHVVRPHRPMAADEVQLIESIARFSGQRVGMLRATERAHLQATTDSLTGLDNRRSLEDSVRDLVHDHVPFAVAMCDLDHFKVVNDTYGHDVGDRALRLFAGVLRNTMRATDLVARHGGEEFVVVMPHVNADAAGSMLERVRLELLGALSDGRLPGFTMSAGVADSSEREDFPNMLMLADERLMRAKQGGRDRIVAP
jgi:diguanylate cyclase (GGDEF)-like protein